MYYGEGWKATINGNEVPILKVDYALRGVEVPSGNHIIEFSFEPTVIQKGGTIALASSVILGFLLLGALIYNFKRKKE